MLRSFMEVDLESIIPNTSLGLDIYILRKNDYVLYRRGNIPFEEANRRQLMESGHGKVYIGSDGRQTYQRYLEAHLSTIVADVRVPAKKKAELVYTTTSALMEDLFSDPRSGDKIQRSKALIENTVNLILSGPETTNCLLSMTAHDYYTYTHSVNVTIFGIALCEQLFGDDSGHDFYELGHGFLLHDLGKSLIDPRIINKPGKLNDEEWEVMRKHPEEGHRLLTETTGTLSHEMRTIVLEHHERYGGGGYPTGKRGDAIHPFGRICILADVFDALTTDRPYQSAMTTFEALSLMGEEMRGHFDEDYFKTFVAVFKM